PQSAPHLAVRTALALTVSAGRYPLLIARYALSPMADLFTDERRYATWLEVEILAAEAQAKVGVVPPEAASAIRDRAGFDVAAIEEREQTTEHDVAAFVDVVQE